MRVYRPSHKDRNGKRVPISKYWIKLRDHNQTVRLFAGYTDKKLTERLGYRLGQLVNYKQSGEPLTDELRKFIEGLSPKDKSKLITWGLVSARVAVANSLAEHIADFKEFLSAKSKKRADAVTAKVNRIIKGCGFQSHTGIQASKITGYLKYLRDSGLSGRTANHYLQAIKQFCNWLVQDGRASESPVKYLKASRILEPDIRHRRRVLEVDEIRRLLEVTKCSSAVRYGMTGYQRYLLYKVAIETGLRRNELRSLTIDSFNFENHIVRVMDAYSKNRKESILPLRKETINELRVFLANKLPNTKVFGGAYKQLTNHTSDMLKADLAEAGIVYRDEQGRVFDFHSLRHETGTLLAASGVHPKVAQSIMRHSDINLTMSLYTHILRGQESEAVAKLPDLSQPSKTAKIS